MTTTRIPCVEPSTEELVSYVVLQQVAGVQYLQYEDEDRQRHTAISDARQYSILGSDAYWAAVFLADPEWMQLYYLRITGWDEHDGVLDLTLTYSFYSNNGLLETPPRDETTSVMHRFVPLPNCDPRLFEMPPDVHVIE